MKSLGERITFQPKNVFLQKLTLFKTRKITFFNIKTRFGQVRRKITGYADVLMMYVNLPVHGHIQKFTKETVFL